MRFSRAVLERIFELASVVMGLAVVGSCSFAGFTEGAGPGILAALISLVIASVVVSAVFIVTRTSADVRAIRKRFEQLQPPPEGHDNEGEHRNKLV